MWSSQSILSAWDDLYDLSLVRWNRHEEWSPWNCILLTKEEASAHEKLENLEEVCIYSNNTSSSFVVVLAVLVIVVGDCYGLPSH